ncbi:MAG: methyltransferase type 11 [Acidimicrobiaceae bacterium]|nr:methyltransferase type 11 [Acidimicrobiaceae bacterium]
MGSEIDLLENYPRTKRNLDERQEQKTEEDRATARRFDRDFFDGDRRTGYGGFHYHPRFWQPVVPTFREFYGLTGDHSLLDVGCAKGFMLKDFAEAIPGLTVSGIDVSEYAVENAVEGMEDHLQVADARELPFEDDSFDLVVSINTLHNFDRPGVVTALSEVQRVSRKWSFVVLDAYRNEEERRRIEAWNLTALTVLSAEGWVKVFDEAGYEGDYYWFIP